MPSKLQYSLLGLSLVLLFTSIWIFAPRQSSQELYTGDSLQAQITAGESLTDRGNWPRKAWSLSTSDVYRVNIEREKYFASIIHSKYRIYFEDWLSDPTGYAYIGIFFDGAQMIFIESDNTSAGRCISESGCFSPMGAVLDPEKNRIVSIWVVNDLNGEVQHIHV